MSATTKTDHALERLVFFSDAVFAIAITLLVLEIHTPVLPRGSPDAAHVKALLDLIPSFAGYLISFAVIGLFWLVHHRAFTLADRYSPKVVPWNMALLGVIAFMPFATAYDAHNLDQRVPGLFYCAALLVAALLNYAVVRIATGPAMARPDAEQEAVRYTRRRSLSIAAGALTALVVVAVVPQYGHLALISIAVWKRLIARPTGAAGSRAAGESRSSGAP
jgi:uncharacterized membrane protein